MKNLLLTEESGHKELLLGNEAIVRGALEAGINMITCYPGTPSSEIPDTFRRLSPNPRFTLEYSVNEKVAYEVAAGASLAGALTMVTMKHVGVNVAADPLMTSTYIGMPGGLVLVSADDPYSHSSQNEQDNRTFARFAGMPCFEPATAQEAKDMARDALLLSRELEQPVLLRTTTRVNHLRGAVEFGALPKPAETVPFKRNPQRFVPVPVVARNRHKALSKQMELAQEKTENSQYNRLHGSTSSKLGILSSGISRTYMLDALAEHNQENEFKLLELGFSYPLPKKLLLSFLNGLDKVLILEELEPLLENAIKALIQENNLNIKVYGKNDILTIYGEYSTTLVAKAIAQFKGKALPTEQNIVAQKLPMRPPNLCAGCSHRAVYRAVQDIYGSEAIYSSDIGCYTLGILPPLNAADFLVCMGSSVSSGSGFARYSDKPVVAFIGDSTFFHSGITGLVNAIFNRHNLTMVILDNGTTAMTGHQPNPGVDQEYLSSDCVHLDIESIVKGCGVTNFAKVKGYNLNAVHKALEQTKNVQGVKVILVEEPCVLFARRTMKRKPKSAAYVVEQSDSVKNCFATLACPSFRKDKNGFSIDTNQCAGCMVCLQISKDIKAKAADVKGELI
ncbi:indolepyruvate ferredoxin oxidoreductase subunit alpha [Desulfovibrio litoralis]|uniref:Indolepyruvate oxidoreductase subunit IorA n=1 Tax=Desulfovibrio litoralis DSM 11393 TaxID=1121455 RepID=A0A1M7RZS6_9BACT|nr:indolepyruvate ferredoxin oxidoreductase subunit alpha [Desulfovibrio litoralis]SHN51688.1 indolepyruvate ferredoxin oxidoreductase alpha subunit [Desulfovibrio litoralis DSM 11393]